ncbi:hypothetical protein ABT77_09655, partial [Salmonella enterica subsp. enterica serovar Typhimurium]
MLLFLPDAGDSRSNRGFTRVGRFGRFASGLLLLLTGFGAGDGCLHCSFTRVVAGYRAVSHRMSGLFSARLRFTRFTGRDDGAIVWLTTRLNNHRLR